MIIWIRIKTQMPQFLPYKTPTEKAEFWS